MPVSSTRLRIAPAARLLRPLASSQRMLHGGTAIRRAVFTRQQADTQPVAAGPRAIRDETVNRVEAVLLLSREPLNSRKLAELASLEDGTHARTTVKQLNKHLDDTGRAFRVEETGGGYIMLTRPKFAPWLRRLEHCPPEIKLSAPAMETLTVIGYRQPVLRADIEAIRGVACGEILRQLMERDLVRIGGRSEELGRPYLYATTRRFLRTFGLRSLNDLPRAESLRATPQQALAKSQQAAAQQTAAQQITDPADEETPAAEQPAGSETHQPGEDSPSLQQHDTTGQTTSDELTSDELTTGDATAGEPDYDDEEEE